MKEKVKEHVLLDAIPEPKSEPKPMLESEPSLKPEPEPESLKPEPKPEPKPENSVLRSLRAFVVAHEILRRRRPLTEKLAKGSVALYRRVLEGLDNGAPMVGTILVPKYENMAYFATDLKHAEQDEAEARGLRDRGRILNAGAMAVRAQNQYAMIFRRLGNDETELEFKGAIKQRMEIIKDWVVNLPA